MTKVSEVWRYESSTDNLQTRIWTAKVRILVILTTITRLLQEYRYGRRRLAEVQRGYNETKVSHETEVKERRLQDLLKITGLTARCDVKCIRICQSNVIDTVLILV